MDKTYEEYLLTWCGLELTESLPRRPEEYYWMILVGEEPPEDYSKLPRRSLGYYLSRLTGIEYSPGTSLETYMMALLGEEAPNDPEELPKRSFDYYLYNYVPSTGFLFYFSIDEAGCGIMQGTEPFPDFYLDEGTGELIYDDNVSGSPDVNDISLSPEGHVIREVS